MSYISTTIKRETSKMSILLDLYMEQLAMLPKGSIRTKERGGKQYFYLSYRDGSRVVTDYIGNDQTKLAALKEQLEQRKHIETVIKGLNKELHFANKVLEGIR